MQITEHKFGIENNSFQAAGELPGLTKLVEAFYGFMQTLPQAKKIRDMHAEDLTESKKKLAYFLSGWLGGPKLYQQSYGQIRIPMAHRHLNVGHDESNAWILCMQKAVEQQDYSEEFKHYLIEQLKVPAERIRMACETKN